MTTFSLYMFTTNLLYLQQYLPKLSQRTVAYINVDIAVFGKKSYPPFTVRTKLN